MKWMECIFHHKWSNVKSIRSGAQIELYSILLWNGANWRHQRLFIFFFCMRWFWMDYVERAKRRTSGWKWSEERWTSVWKVEHWRMRMLQSATTAVSWCQIRAACHEGATHGNDKRVLKNSERRKRNWDLKKKKRKRRRGRERRRERWRGKRWAKWDQSNDMAQWWYWNELLNWNRMSKFFLRWWDELHRTILFWFRRFRLIIIHGTREQAIVDD